MSGVFPFSHWKCKLIFNGLETLWNKHLYYPFEFSASGLLWIKLNKSNTVILMCLFVSLSGMHRWKRRDGAVSSGKRERRQQRGQWGLDSSARCSFLRLHPDHQVSPPHYHHPGYCRLCVLFQINMFSVCKL